MAPEVGLDISKSPIFVRLVMLGSAMTPTNASSEGLRAIMFGKIAFR